MATRPTVQETYCIAMPFTVATSKTCTKGLAVIFSGADNAIEIAPAASDLAIGIAQKSGVAGDVVEVKLFTGAILKATAGTGGVTRGTKQTLVTDGFTDASADNGATTSVPTYGIAMNSANAADEFGLLACPANRTKT